MTTTKPEEAGWQFLAVLGSAYAALNDTDDKRLAQLLWQQLPLAKALVELGINNPVAMQALWDKHLKDAMPYGEPPIGTPPTDDGWRMQTYAEAKDIPTAQLQRACAELHEGDSFFTNVMALGSYNALNMSTGEQRVQVGVAARLNREHPAGVAALAQRLREVLADLDGIAATVRQPQS